MEHSLWLAAAGLIVSFALWIPAVWQFRKKFSTVLILVELVSAGAFIFSGHSMLAIIFISVSVYKCLNFARISLDRIQQDYLSRVSWRSQYLLSTIQGAVLMLAAGRLSVSGAALLAGIAIVELLLAIAIFSSTLRHLKTTKTLQATRAYTDQELPTLSVLVPARNETADLEACLQTLVASNYPKLEIIVLDDCSQTKRTPEIIRSFAHAGVRFIAGAPADETWLAKNYAYQQLAEASNGDYLLFCGVDVRMDPNAMRELITTMLEKQKTMLSVLPRNIFPTEWRARLVQPMRYAWELSLPRRLFNRPPVLSTCWIIQRETFTSSGTFMATCRTILPESYFARFAARSDGYSFLRSNMLASDKAYEQQRSTTVRMRYPQLRRRLELVWAVSVFEVIGLVSPLPVFVSLLVVGQGVYAAVALLAFILQQAVIIMVTSVMYGRPLWHSVHFAPLHDLVLINYSMYRYEFQTVVWKDRNICLPVMRIDSESESKRLNRD